jgi:outer membrane protein assembly factor BamB
LERRRRLEQSLIAVSAFGLLLAGCGNTTHPKTARVQSTPASNARRSILTLRVVDGDTGQRLPNALVEVSRAVRKGRSRFVIVGRSSVFVTARATHYAARKIVLPLRHSADVTVRLYRVDGQWLMYGVTPARTQYQATIPLRPPFRVVWGRDLGALLEFPAVIDGGVAYITDASGEIFALSMSNGRTLWKVNMHTTTEASSPAVVGDKIVAHAKSGRVLVFDRLSGRLRWSWLAQGEIESSPVVVDETDYLGDSAGNVYALNLRNRKLRWVYHDGCKITASAAIAGGVLYIGDYCGRVLALEQATGRLLWRNSAGSPIYGTSAVAAGRLFVPSRDVGALYAFTTGGRYLWQVPTGGLVYTAPAVSHGRVYFGSYSGTLYCVSALTGHILWRLNAGGRISGSPTVVAGVVYIASFAHRIIGADARNGHVFFSFPHGEYVAVSGNRARLLLYGWASLWAVRSLH